MHGRDEEGDRDNQVLVNRATAILTLVSFEMYTFEARAGHGGVFIQAWYMDEDQSEKGVVKRWFTRKWLLSPHATDSEIVQTAFKCVITSMEHRAREGFRYKDKQVFGPHFDVEDLVSLCANNGTDKGARKL